MAGSVESIRQITAQTLYDCHRAFYTPANMCLVVVGDVDADKVLAAAERILPKTSGPDIPRDHGPVEDLTAAQPETACAMEVAMPTFLLGFKCPPVRCFFRKSLLYLLYQGKRGLPCEGFFLPPVYAVEGGGAV